ncbi:hypothetical protein BKA61DRAFT_585472 [Leptodontidium sp. MPI-SDFR-AT-0119]|nr:hypothetical protein BKA61DRAFT_585472 [Leptodontidium sp. MPI-SDFR-AT-0119]
MASSISASSSIPQPSTPSLLILPTEMHNQIVRFLPLPDRWSLRQTNTHFAALISAHTHSDLLFLEREGAQAGFGPRDTLLTCIGCTKLLRMSKFSPKMYSKKKARGGVQAGSRFCIECGKRPLPGTNRYQKGARWKEAGRPWVRCVKCGDVGEGSSDQAVQKCLVCLEVTALNDAVRVRAARSFLGRQRGSFSFMGYGSEDEDVY